MIAFKNIIFILIIITLISSSISMYLTNMISNMWKDPKHSLPFDLKIAGFYGELNRKLDKGLKQWIQVDRNAIFDDSFSALSSLKQLPLDVNVSFKGEHNLYQAGLTVEWLSLLTKKMFSSDQNLFKYCSDNNFAVEINPLSAKNNRNQFEHFQFVGKIFAFAVYKKHPIDVSFSPIFLKSILGIPIDLEDVQVVDPGYYKSLMDVQKDPSSLELYFIENEKRSNGKMAVIKLIENGDTKKVTRWNVNNYINLLIERRYVGRIRLQTRAFLNGLNSFIPLDFFKFFHVNELELLFCGTPIIDLNDWRKNTKVIGVKGENCPNEVKWFWEVVESFSDMERAKLLQFVTGSSRVPITGFKEFKKMAKIFTINMNSYLKRNFLPTANTCINQLNLPEYDNKKVMEKKIRIAINESNRFVM